MLFIYLYTLTVIMITYLHHTDPNLPHYRGKEWNFQRGAAATVDRPFLGWQGRFFLHDVAHYHVVHHVSAFSVLPNDQRRSS
jgi:fatty acid desaturase